MLLGATHNISQLTLKYSYFCEVGIIIGNRYYSCYFIAQTRDLQFEASSDFKVQDILLFHTYLL